jgi:hypothetical protein
MLHPVVGLYITQAPKISGGIENVLSVVQTMQQIPHAHSILGEAKFGKQLNNTLVNLLETHNFAGATTMFAVVRQCNIALPSWVVQSLVARLEYYQQDNRVQLVLDIVDYFCQNHSNWNDFDLTTMVKSFTKKKMYQCGEAIYKSVLKAKRERFIYGIQLYY